MRLATILGAVALALTACGGQPDVDVAGGPSASPTPAVASPTAPVATLPPASPSPTTADGEGEPPPDPAGTGVATVAPPSPSEAPPGEPSREQPPQPAPPSATVTGAAGTLTLEQGSYCWTETDPDGSGAGVCADTIGPGEQTPGFAASQGEVLTFAFDTDDAPGRVELFIRPVEGGEDAENTQVALDAANPTAWEVALQPGSHYVVVTTDWPQGDASYHVRVDVS